VKQDEEIATIETDKVGVCHERAFGKGLWLTVFRLMSPSMPRRPAQSLSSLLRRRTPSPSARTSSSWSSGELQRKAVEARKLPKSRRHRRMLLPKSPEAGKPLLMNSVRRVRRYQRQSKNLLLRPLLLLPPNLQSKLNGRDPRQSHPNLSPPAKEGSATAKRSV